MVPSSIDFLSCLSPECKDRDDKDLQLSDLEEFDPLESESPECELKHRFQISAHMETKDPQKLSIPGLKSPEDCELELRHSKACFQQQQQHQSLPILDSKPRIWSLAQTATSLNPAELPSCMLRCPASPSPAGGPDRQQDSPVTTLRNWVDGVFHDPLFRHSSLNQTNTTVSWTTKGSILETGALGRSVADSGKQEAGKDTMTFPKGVNKIFCS